MSTKKLQIIGSIGGSGSNVELDTTLTQEGKAADAKAVGDAVAQKSQVQIVTPETAEILQTLKIHRLTQEEYNEKVISGEIDENALYLTPNEEIDLSGYVTTEQLNAKADVKHNHDSLYDPSGSADTALASAKEHSNINLEAAKLYSDTGDSITLEESKIYTNNAVKQKSLVQIITWEDDD